MRRLIPALAVGALLAAVASPESTPRGLEELWSQGWILRDTNGDGLVDRVEAGVRVGSARAVATAGAADLAARLGFETMSLDLPIPDSHPTLTFAVDERPEGGAGVRLGAGLPLPGRGFVYLDAGREPTVSLWGDDDAGLREAAAAVAGRLPALWDPDGLTLAEARDALVAALRAAGVDAGPGEVRGLVVRTDLDGIERLLLRVRVPEGTIGSWPPATVDAIESAVPDAVGEVRLWLDEAGTERVVSLTGPGLASRAPAGPRHGGGRERLSLADMYEPGGLLGDEDGDRVPDRTDVLISTATGPVRGLVDLAARFGVEAAGVTLPVVVPADVHEPAEGPIPLLVGATHPAVEELAKQGKLATGPPPGWGRLEVVPEAYEDDLALVVRGDAPGRDAVLDWLARTAPHLGPRGADRPTIANVEEALWRFLGLRSAGGQAAGALYALEDLTARIPDGAGDIEVDVALEGPSDGLAELVRRRLGERPARVAIENLDVGAATAVLDETFEIDGEPAALRRALGPVRERLTTGSRVDVEARVSEPRAVRRRLEEEIREAIGAAGATAGDVAVLPAYKQGFGWLEEVVLPRLRDAAVASVVIRFAPNEPPADWPGQAMGTPTRWLLELHPIDEVLARELELPIDAVRFEQAPTGAPTYEVVARAADGGEILRETFEPRTVVRPYFDVYPRYERVRVTTGGVRVAVDGAPLLDEPIATDPERVWDLFQSRVLTVLHDYVLRLHEGRPRASLAPHFGSLVIEVELSEPERALGVDQERIAPMESLHEELYFGTLHFMDLLGRVSSGAPLSYPGRVIPIVRPLAHGRGGTVRFHLTGFTAPGPRVEVRFTKDGRLHTLERELLEIDVARPVTTAVTVEAGAETIDLELYLAVDSEQDPRAELVARTSARRVDTDWVAGARVHRTLEVLAELSAAGLYRRELAFAGLGRLTVATATGHAIDLAGARTASLEPQGDPEPLPDPARLLARGTGTGTGTRPLVQWRTPIPPDEAHGIVATLAAEFDEAAAFRAGRSYLGREIWALELMAPLPGSHWSRAKAAELKPTVVYSARQHANEVSSTSHVLRLAEELLTDPVRRRALDRVNVIVHPITNPDGAQLAYDLWQITPDHMLHAGYLGSLGVDVTAGSGDEDPIYPESNVRERLWEMWRPDVFLNPHGYPSHEWVQMFSEYAGWVRHRTTESRDWWGMRGWFMPGFSYLDDPDHPRHREEAFRLRGYITRAINAVGPVAELNRRAYARYRRYGADFDPEAFKLDFADDVLIYTSIKGSRAGGGGWVERNPKVTIWAGSTEAPDETAHGDWLELVASAGLAWDRAILAYLIETEHEIERTHEVIGGGFRLAWHRERPGRPPDEGDEDGVERP